MFRLVGVVRSSARLSSHLASVCSGSRTSILSNKKDESQFLRYSSTSKSTNLSEVSRIKLIAPHLRKSTRRRRTLASLYKNEEYPLPKVVGMAKAESFDLCAICEDESFNSFYQASFLDESRRYIWCCWICRFQTSKMHCTLLENPSIESTTL